MVDVRFDDYVYFPALRTRSAELKGLEQVDDERKKLLLPLLTLGRWPRATAFDRAAERARDAMDGLPYFVDLTTDAAHLGEQQAVLRNPDNAFANWRSFSSGYAGAIPVVQFGTSTRIREVTKQAQHLERDVGKLAFRIRDFVSDTALVISAISALDDPRNAIVFIDCQYIRSAFAAFLSASISSINDLRSQFPELFVVVLSTSYPPSVVPFSRDGQRGSIDIMERDLHNRIGGAAVAAYGDHGSVHSVVYDDVTMMRWAARVDYPQEQSWHFERRPGDQTAAGYAACARSILTLDAEIGSRGIWGERMIRLAAEGSVHGKAPAPWIAVRVNIHLSRQLDLSRRIADADGDAEDDLEDGPEV